MADTDLNDFWMEHLKNEPMMMCGMSDWELGVFCAKCDMEIPEGHTCIQKKYFDYGHDLQYELVNRIKNRSCPHCKTAETQVRKDKSVDKYYLASIETTLKHTRHIYLEPEKKNFFGRTLPRKSIKETKNIKNDS